MNKLKHNYEELNDSKCEWKKNIVIKFITHSNMMNFIWKIFEWDSTVRCIGTGKADAGKSGKGTEKINPLFLIKWA